MSRVLFLNGPLEGHINPTLGLVEELVARGEEVVYFATEEYRARIEKTGAAFRGYQDFLQDVKRGPRHFMRGAIKVLKSHEEIMPRVLEEVRQGGEFDYVIHDSILGAGHLAARKLGVPSVSSVTTLVPVGRLAMWKQARLEKFKNLLIYAPQMMHLQKVCKRIQRLYGGKTPEIEDLFFNEGDLNIVYTSRQFQPDAEELGDAAYKFVGPSIADRKEPSDLPCEQLQGDKLIYISLGTVMNEAVDFYRQCFAAFGELDVRVVLSVGRKVRLEELGEIPANFLVRPYVAQLEVLQRADVFVTHGGMNSTSEALYYGVPLVVIPSDSDQPMVAGRVAALGAGIHLERDDVSPDTLRRAVEMLLITGSYRRKAEEIGASFREAGGYRQAVDEIEAFKAEHGIR